MENKVQNDYMTERVILLLEDSIKNQEESIRRQKELLALFKTNGVPKEFQISEERKQKNDPAELRMLVARHLHKIGIPQHLLGYKYLKEGIAMAIEDPTMLDGIVRVFYPRIAQKYKIQKWVAVERSIRTAIELCYKKGNREVLKEYFSEVERLTNSHFIAALVEKVQEDILKN